MHVNKMGGKVHLVPSDCKETWNAAEQQQRKNWSEIM